MKFLSRLFTPKSEPLQERADALVPAASICAIGLYESMSDQFLFLQHVDTKHWDFIVTIGAVFIAATRLHNLRGGDALEQHLMDRVAERLNQWNPNGLRGFEHCKSFFERTYDALTANGHKPQFTASDTIGSWIIWDILDRAPHSDEERRLVRVVGAAVTHEFFNWWSEQNS